MIEQLIRPGIPLELTSQGFFKTPIGTMSKGMKANAEFFSHPKWGQGYFKLENHRNLIGERWRHATGDWTDKIVVDLGSGPGNLFRCVNGIPKLLLGVDISEGALEHALKLGYTCLLADIHKLPLISEFADLVTANAVLHHVDSMEIVLSEAARLVRPGGLLVSDEDPLMYHHKHALLQKAFSTARSLIPISRVMHHPEQRWKFTSPVKHFKRQATELHFQFPGDGVRMEMYRDILEPMGFDVSLYPHGHMAGKDIFTGDKGSNGFLTKLRQRLTGSKPEESLAFLSLMCVAKKRDN